MNQRAPSSHGRCRSLTRNDPTTSRTRLCIQPSARQLAHAGVDERVARPTLLPGREARGGGVGRGRVVAVEIDEPRLHGVGGRPGPVPEHVGVEVAPRDLAGDRRRTLAGELGEVGQHRPGVQVAPAQRGGDVRGRVGPRDVVQPLVVGRPVGLAAQPVLPAPAGGRLARRGGRGRGRAPRGPGGPPWRARRPSPRRPRGPGRARRGRARPGGTGRTPGTGVPLWLLSVPGATAYGEPGRVQRATVPGQGVGDPGVAPASVRAEVRADVHGRGAEPGGDAGDHLLGPALEHGQARSAARRGSTRSRSATAAVSHAARPSPAERRRTGSLTKRGRTAGPSSTAAPSAGLSARRKSRRTHQITGRSGGSCRLVLRSGRTREGSRCFDGPARRPRRAERERSHRHHGDVPPDDLRARGGGDRPPPRPDRRAAAPERPDGVARRSRGWSATTWCGSRATGTSS